MSSQEPGEEFETQTFDDAYSKGLYTAGVEQGHLVEGSAYIWVSDKGVSISHESAPAFALAILEAAGYGDQTLEYASCAVLNLKREAKKQAKRKAAAEEAKKLDEEARTLWESAFKGHDAGIAYDHRVWEPVARKARELHSNNDQ